MSSFAIVAITIIGIVDVVVVAVIVAVVVVLAIVLVDPLARHCHCCHAAPCCAKTSSSVIAVVCGFAVWDVCGLVGW